MSRNLSIDSGYTIDSSTNAREINGLCGSRDPGQCSHSGRSVIGADPSGGRKYDLSKSDKQNSATRKKAPISAWRRRLSVCRHPSIESIDSLAANNTINNNNFTRANSDHGNLHAAESINNDVVVVPSLAAKRVNTNRNSPFCPCFSPTESDDDDEIAVAELTDAAESESTACNNNNNNNNNSCRQIIHMAREIRSRLVVAGNSINQSAGPAEIRRLGDGMLMSEQPYPVHTTVEYTHYLVPDLMQITNAPYYWGIMDRFEAERLLDGKPEGTFLLRDSAQNEYLFSVSFRRYQRTLHARIEEMNRRFSFDSYDPSVFSAPNVTELIDNYKDPSRCLFFEPQLTHRLNRNFVFPLQHLCRAAICSSQIEYNDLNRLQIPRKLKEYMREYHFKQAVRVLNNERN